MRTLALAAAVFALVFASSVALGAADVTPASGKETLVSDSSVGPAGRYAVYLPPNYDSKKVWPAIFCYHGRGGGPTVQPYKDFVNGKDFVLIGMDYWWDSMNVASKIDRDVEVIKKLAPQLVKSLNLDNNQLFIVGNSAGGFAVSGIAEATLSAWAGIAILGAGRYEHLHKNPDTLPSVGSTFAIMGFGMATQKSNAKPTDSFPGKPIYISAGESDENLWWAQKARDFYQGRGATIVFETYAGVGHGVYPATKAFQDWFYANGPAKQVDVQSANASQAINSGDLGQAYNLLSRVANLPGIPDQSKDKATEAGQKADLLAKEAQSGLQAAQKAVEENRQSEALKTLNRIASSFKGSEFGDQASSSIMIIRKRPADEKKAGPVLEAQALAVEKQSLAAEQAKDYLSAFSLYQQYLAKFKDSERYEAVKKHFDELQANPKVQDELARQKAEKECSNLFTLAENFLRTNQRERAKECLRKIVDQYGDTNWAQRAREKMSSM